jgi:hypothetical protein
MDNIEYLVNNDNWEMVYSILLQNFQFETSYLYLEACYRIHKDIFRKECIDIVNGKIDIYDKIYYKLKSRGWYETCFEFANIIYDLFNGNWKILYDILYLSNVLSRKEEGKFACDLLLLNLNTPENIRKKVLIIQQGMIISPIINRKRLMFPILYPFRPMNFFLTKTDDGYFGILRTVNYLVDNDGSYKHEGIWKTENFFIRFDTDYNLVYFNKLNDDNISNKININSLVIGYEDCRLIDNNTFICSTAEFNDKGTPQIAICKFDIDNIKSVIPLRLYNDDRVEKNWIPFPGDKRKFIYSFFPFVILNVNDDNQCYISNYIEWTLSFEGFRGSSTFIPYNNGYLTLIHYCSSETAPKSYYHRLLWFDVQFETGLISTSFTFENRQIEYCLSINISHDMKSLIFTYSVYDDRTSIGEIPLRKLDSLLCNYFERK